ncbi:MAG TPA: zinc ABC transporter substrate-binding protein [Devosiaceae bacterium]|nr:zinc ABC transporter substrate-binding protein [Devosiaceae bacterium]
MSPRLTIARAALALAATSLAAPAAAAPAVVATILPVHGIVAAVMAGVGEPVLLIDRPVSPHAYALTPSKRRLLDAADLVIGIGPGMETGIWEAVEAMRGRHLALLDSIADGLIGPAGAADPHVWLDTALAARMADAVAAGLTAADPENATRYAANAAGFAETLAALDADIGEALLGHPDGIAVSYHDAFAYFARQWHLGYGYVVPEPEIAPAAGTVAALRDRAAKGGIACFMTEPQYRPDLLEALAGDFGLSIVEIDPVGTAIAPGPGCYPVLIRQVAAAFAACLSP